MCHACQVKSPAESRRRGPRRQARPSPPSAALAAKRGEQKKSDLVGASKDMYESMTEDELEELASTKRKSLPEKAGKS